MVLPNDLAETRDLWILGIMSSALMAQHKR